MIMMTNMIVVLMNAIMISITVAIIIVILFVIVFVIIVSLMSIIAIASIRGGPRGEGRWGTQGFTRGGPGRPWPLVPCRLTFCCGYYCAYYYSDKYDY